MSTVKASLIRVETIRFHAHNVRRDLGDLRSLAASIKRFGVMQPIVAEDQGSTYRLRAGHRRVAAARMVGLERIPALIHSETLDDEGWLIQAVQENVMRRGLDLNDRADAIAALRKAGCTWEGIAEAFDVTPGTARSWSQQKAEDAAPHDERTEYLVAVAKDLRDQGRSYAQIADQMHVSPKHVDRLLNGRVGNGNHKSYTVTKRYVREFIEQWEGKPDATAADVLAALSVEVQR